jgi:hypothetical protein
MKPISHVLKTWPEPFKAIWNGTKRHEVRLFDREFKVGQRVLLVEWDNLTKMETGRNIDVRITYITEPGTWDLPKRVGVFSFRVSCRTDNSGFNPPVEEAHGGGKP